MVEVWDTRSQPCGAFTLFVPTLERVEGAGQ